VSRIDLAVPDLGGFKDVPVIDVLVAAGDHIEIDTALITLETEKASMDVPATAAGKVLEVLIHRGDKVSSGSLIVRIEADNPAPAAETSAAVPPAAPTKADDATRAPAAATKAADATRAPAAPTTDVSVEEEPADRSTGLLVLGAGPAGYTAAFRAADLGLQVTLVERSPTLGGVCLNVGCIPSKALLHAAKVIEDADAMSAHGISFGAPAIDLPQLRAWKASIVKKLTGGLKVLAKQRKVEVLQGTGRFVSPHVLEIKGAGAPTRIRFEQFRGNAAPGTAG
jgi:dihydrolipoamide dehydrogenase